MAGARAQAKPVRQRNQRGEGARLKEELIEAAMRILDRSPATVLSLRMVAREAGVAAPSVYAHFPDAQHLTAGIVRECWQQLAHEMARALPSPGGCSAIDTLKAELTAYVQYAMERPSRYQLLFAMQQSAEGVQQGLPGLVQPAFRMIRQSLKAIKEGGGKIPGNSSFDTALLVTSLVHGRIALAHLAPSREGNSTLSVMAFVADALDRLITTR